ncbi:MAG TPA: Ldh family oxidoreductase [Pirellulales bacterium]|nr:Ldh family oxidoreductase [Pirellulales bacterium]
MPRLISHERISRIGIALFEAAGAPPGYARTVVDHLIESSLMGHDSHGVLRIPEYLDDVVQGRIMPAAPVRVEPQSPTTAIVDGGGTFGAVVGRAAIDEAIRTAREHRLACLITRHCHHVGRLGAFVERAARHGFIALATCNSPVYGHFVLPWGGREGRLATNPIAYGVPTRGDPLVADFSTSVAPEGKIRFHRNERKPLPAGWLLDAEGRPTTDAASLYATPRGGILPLGGAAGHKGFALGLLVEILGAALAGHGCDDPNVVGNGVCFIVIDPSAFGPLDRFEQLVSDTAAYIKSSPPAVGFDEVLVPGELEFRTLRRRSQEGVPVDEVTWRAIELHAQRLGVAKMSS